MFGQFLNIVVRSIKLDKSLYKDKANYLELGFYYSLIIVVITIIIQTIPNNVYLSWMSEKGLWQDQEPLNFRNLLFLSLLIWFIKSIFIFLIGVKVFPNKNTKCNFLKVLTTVGFAHSPLIFNFLIFNDSLLYGILLIYVWYVSALVVGINEILNYENKLKSFLISFIAPIVISLSLFILYVQISI